MFERPVIFENKPENIAGVNNLYTPSNDYGCMLELPLHAGTEHPNLTLVVLSSLLTFVAGLGIGTYSDRLREFVRTLGASSTE